MSERVKVKDDPKTKKGADAAGDLHDALADSFPASDPPAVTQPNKPGAPAPKDPAPQDKGSKRGF